MEPREDADAALPYATAYHAPVLCHDVIRGLVTDRAGLYVDATLGGGGHAAALLDALAPEGRVVGIDRDAEALEASTQRLKAEVERGRFSVLRGSFGDLEALLAEAGIEKVTGLLLDLGVSSHQLDEGSRGFSFRYDAPLDMRMDVRQSFTAATIVNEWGEEALRLLFQKGEEPRCRHIARRIVAQRPVETTGALADLVRSAVPQREEAKAVTRVFQALRLEVNGEMKALESVLEASARCLTPGGRVAVLAYHSLEDRRAKRFLRHGNFEGESVRDFYGNRVAPFREITRQPISASDEEARQNPRARSARLRIAERLPETVNP